MSGTDQTWSGRPTPTGERLPAYLPLVKQSIGQRWPNLYSWIRLLYFTGDPTTGNL